MSVDGLDTTGKRLRYFREEDVREPRGKFIEGLGITARTLERYENDDSAPDAAFLTKLNSKYHGRVNLDWLITGRGEIYAAPPAAEQRKQAALREDEAYYDVVLEKMRRQLDRVYAEKDFEKLAALQSLLNLIDPERGQQQ